MSTLLPIKPLDGERGFLRWKESVLLRLRTLGLAAHVLRSEEKRRRSSDENQWAHDDALCRGHILITLSDRLIPVYDHHATAGALWRALTRTYHDVTYSSSRKAFAFRYKEGQPVREQLALLEAFATAANLSDRDVADIVKEAGFPQWMLMKVAMNRSALSMDDIWDIAQQQAITAKDDQTSSASEDFRPQKRGRRQGRS